MGVEERTDEEQLFGSIMVPHVSTAAANCLPCVDQCDDVETGEEDGVKRGVNAIVSEQQGAATKCQCLFAVLSARNGGHEPVSCVRGCRGRKCGRNDGHVCST